MSFQFFSTSPLYSVLSNFYYIYSASSELVTFPTKVHRVFSVVDMAMCLDFFPALERLKTAIYKTTKAKEIADKVHAFIDVISESAGVFSDVYWFIEEVKSFNIILIPNLIWIKTVYERTSFLQYLWIGSSVYQSYKIALFMFQFHKVCKDLSVTTPFDERQSAIKKSCRHILHNYEVLEKSFTISSNLREKISAIMKEASHEKGLSSFQKLKRKITCVCLLDNAAAVNNVLYYSLYIVKTMFIKNRVISLILVACCISSLVLSILSLHYKL